MTGGKILWFGESFEYEGNYDHDYHKNYSKKFFREKVGEKR